MRVIIKNLLGFSVLAMALLSSACGNKGDLFLDGSQFLVNGVQPIERALDELEAFEAEEAVTTGKALENTVLEGDALPSGNKSKE